jgi:predicted amidohydrolase YtcJ
MPAVPNVMRLPIAVVSSPRRSPSKAKKVTGSLEEGKLADLVVLNQNITEVPLDDISNTDVLMTMVGGKKVWVDPSF